MRRLLMFVALVGCIAVADGCERTNTIVKPGTVDTLLVYRPGRVDTIIVTRVDTLLRTHVDTVVRQLPGRVDTLFVPRVDTTFVPRTDTLIVVTHDTTVVVRHDTVTIVHTDTVYLSRVPAWVCLSLMQGDTLYALTSDNGPYCDAAHLAPQFPAARVFVNLTSKDTLKMTLPAKASPLRSPSPLILPGYWQTHRP